MHDAGCGRDASRQLVFIADPVAHGSSGSISAAKPPVIQYKEFYAGFFGQFRLSFDFFQTYITVHGFPGIQQNRARPAGKMGRNQMVQVKLVEVMAHSIKSLVTVI